MYWFHSADELIALLTVWIEETTDIHFVNAAEALLSALFPSLSAHQVNGLDITAYVAALGLPKLLDCASFFDFLSSAVQDTEMARHELCCCADLVRAFLSADEQSITSS